MQRYTHLSWIEDINIIWYGSERDLKLLPNVKEKKE